MEARNSTKVEEEVRFLYDLLKNAEGTRGWGFESLQGH